VGGSLGRAVRDHQEVVVVVDELVRRRHPPPHRRAHRADQPLVRRAELRDEAAQLPFGRLFRHCAAKLPHCRGGSRAPTTYSCPFPTRRASSTSRRPTPSGPCCARRSPRSTTSSF